MRDVAHAASLENWSERDWTDGVQLDELPDFACLHVRTRFSVYELIVLNGRSGEILLRGGRKFPVYTRARLEGSSLGGSFLKLLGIYIGFRMELRTADDRLVTSRVQSISSVHALS